MAFLRDTMPLALQRRWPYRKLCAGYSGRPPETRILQMKSSYLYRAALLLIGIVLPWIGFPAFAVITLFFIWLLVLIALVIRGKMDPTIRKALTTSAFLVIGLVLGVAFSLIAFIAGPA